MINIKQFLKKYTTEIERFIWVTPYQANEDKYLLHNKETHPYNQIVIYPDTFLNTLTLHLLTDNHSETIIINDGETFYYHNEAVEVGFKSKDLNQLLN